MARHGVVLTATAVLAAVSGAAARAGGTSPSDPSGGPTHHLSLTLRPASGSLLPSAAEVASVTSALQRRGLQVDGLQGLTLAVSGSASEVASTFRSSATAGLTQAALGAAGSGVAAGYDATASPVTWHRHATTLTGAQATVAYAVPGASLGKVATPTLSASTPVVATIQLAGWSHSDLTAFAPRVFTDSSYDPVASGQYSYVNVPASGVPTGSESTKDGNGDEVEVALDQEAVLSAAPTLKQRAYFANNSGPGLLAAYNAVLTDVSSGKPIVALSVSWGGCEKYQGSLPASLESVLHGLVNAGVTIFAASGDDGTDDCRDGSVAVDYPAASPYVVAVGGTSHPNGPSAPLPDTAWEDSTSGSGGGASSLFARPSWQDGLSGTGTGRLVPDLAMDGDPGTGLPVVVNGSPALAGGTSLAAPFTAAMLADTVKAAGRTTGLGDIHSLIYHHSGDFTDVVASQLGGTSNGIIEPAGTCYDEATGLGTPNFTALVADAFGSGSGTSPCGGWTPGIQQSPSPAPSPAPTTAPPATVIPVPQALPVVGAPVAVGQPSVAVTRWVRGARSGAVSAAWTVADPGAAIASQSVVVRRSTDQRIVGYWDVDPLTRAAALTLPPGSTYDLQVTVTDALGVSAAARSASVLLPVDDRASKRSAGWKASVQSRSLDATVMTTARVGATASATVVGSKVGVIVATAPDGGRFQLLVDGHVALLVDTRGPRRYQVTITVTVASKAHLVAIRVLGRGKGTATPVAIDGFVGS